MKTDIFLKAIKSRNKLKFLYSLTEIMIEPYYVARDKSGRKVIYGRVRRTNEVRKFEYNKISNIRILNEAKFSPVIPIISHVS
jgi:predicted DNA-binding transcriptional regulator YafY